MKAVIMAGGFGTRIQPLTNSIPKPMLPIMNKPMMEHTMMMLKDLGIQEFIVLLYFKSEVIKNYFKDGSDFGIQITYVVPDDDYGTAGAVKKAQEYIGTENFIIISGDLVTDFDFQKIFDYHKEKKSKLTITLTSVENPLEFGIVIADKEGKIEKFLEKPSWGEVFSDTINTGIYIIEPEILDYIPKNENFDFAKDLFPLLMRQEIDLMAGHAQGYWRDVGNPESYRDVHEDIFTGKVKFQPSGKTVKYPDGILICEEDNTLDETVEIIGTVLIGKNAIVKRGSKLKNVVIGNNVSIGSSSKISNSIIWDNVEIGKNAKLDGCVICSNNVIGKNVIAKSGLILAQGCEIGELVTVEKDVTIWPDKVIEAASIISRSVILGSRYRNSIFENGMVIGKSNVELSCEMATKLAEAFATQLPIGSKVIVSRHYDKSSRMLKRAFLGGLLANGVDAVDCSAIPLTIMRRTLSSHDEYIAGVHFHQKIDDPTASVIAFFNSEAFRISNDVAKKIEKSFFKDAFRRVDPYDMGQIYLLDCKSEFHQYKKEMETVLRFHKFKSHDCRIAVDMMHGAASGIFSEILNELGVDNIMFNAYFDEQRLGNMNALIKRTNEDMGAIIKALKLDAGFVLDAHEHRLDIICDNGILLSRQTALCVVLTLLNLESKVLGRKIKVFLPTWAADIFCFDELDIEQGRLANFKATEIKKYDLVATGEGHFTFTEFLTHHDSMYATLRILEMLVNHNVKLSNLIARIPHFFYNTYQIDCAQALKGKMMRKFLEDSKGKKSSILDGVKIWFKEHDWVLMLPDQYSDHLSLTIQAENDKDGEKYMQTYIDKIAKWSIG